MRGHKIAGMYYDDLPLDVRTIFDAYPAGVVIVEDATHADQEDEVRDMFLRRQGATAADCLELRLGKAHAVTYVLARRSGQKSEGRYI